MVTVSTRIILLVASLVAAYFATLFGFYSQGWIRWWFSVSSKDNLWWLVAIVSVIATFVAFFVGMSGSIFNLASAVNIDRGLGGTQTFFDFSLTAACAAFFLCFVYGVVGFTGEVVWYKNPWSLLLVFAFVPSIFVTKNLLFEIFFKKVEQPGGDNVHTLDRTKAN
jgi:hypothetical protein